MNKEKCLKRDYGGRTTEAKPPYTRCVPATSKEVYREEVIKLLKKAWSRSN